ncbi:hypothetical protein D3C76_1442520 [compost metagenome]
MTPMFSPLVIISEVPMNPPRMDASASPRMVRVTSLVISSGLSTASLIATVCPVASTMETRQKSINGIEANRSN